MLFVFSRPPKCSGGITKYFGQTWDARGVRDLRDRRTSKKTAYFTFGGGKVPQETLALSFGELYAVGVKN
jgi:hypothetical protein